MKDESVVEVAVSLAVVVDWIESVVEVAISDVVEDEAGIKLESVVDVTLSLVVVV